MSNLFHRAKKAMNERRQASRESVRSAINSSTPRSAGLMFDLSRGEKGKTLDTNRRAHVKAIELVSALLGSFSLPVRPTLEYHGMIKNAVDSHGNISDGVVRVGAVLRTLMGHKAHIDIPVIVRGKNLVEPAVFFYDNAPYVMCGPAIDELVKRGSLQKDVQGRHMYSPPIEGLAESAREGITNHEHMFSPGARNPYNFRRQYSKQAGLKDNTEDPAFNAWLAIDAQKDAGGVDLGQAIGPNKDYLNRKNELDLASLPGVCSRCMRERTEGGERICKKCKEFTDMYGHDASRTAQHKGEPRKRTNIDTPTECPEIWDHDVQDEMLDPAERRRKNLYGVGSDVVLTEDIQARERGGGHLIIPSGEHGRVLKDMEGDGKMLYVSFPDMLLSMPVPKRMLRNAATRRVTADLAPDYIHDTLLVRYGNDQFVLGASGYLEVQDDYDPEETNSLQGHVQFVANKWEPWSSDKGSAGLADKLNQENWMVSLTTDAIDADEHASWSKIGNKSAASIEQVRNEVKAMLREGYATVDIKDAVKRKYPEHAAEALSDLGKSAAILFDAKMDVTFPSGMGEDEVVARAKAMISREGQLIDSEFGTGRVENASEFRDGMMEGTLVLQIDSAFVNGMVVGKYMEASDGQVGVLLEPPGFSEV